MAHTETSLKKAIRAAGLTQRELADRIGVHESQVSRYVHGLMIPDEHRDLIERALDFDLSDRPATEGAA